MKRLLKTLKWTGIVLGSLFLVFFLFVQFSWDKKYDAPFPDIKASTDLLSLPEVNTWPMVRHIAADAIPLWKMS